MGSVCIPGSEELHQHHARPGGTCRLRLAAYDSPYPDNPYLHAVRRFALLIPLSPGDEATPAFNDAWDVLTTLKTPLRCVFGADDHVTGGDYRALSDHIPGAADQPHIACPYPHC
jgi:haloalkane dehalogenase